MWGRAGRWSCPGDVKRIGRYVIAAHAGATHRSYAADADAFAIWCARRGAVALPAAPETVAAYLTTLADAGVTLFGGNGQGRSEGCPGLTVSGPIARGRCAGPTVVPVAVLACGGGRNAAVDLSLIHI